MRYPRPAPRRGGSGGALGRWPSERGSGRGPPLAAKPDADDPRATPVKGYAAISGWP